MKWFLALVIFAFVGMSVAAQSSVRINEFLIDPVQKVELINIGSSAADISGWFIDDSGGTTYFTIPQDNILHPNSCSVFESDFNLNKSSTDTVRLFSSVAPPVSSSAALIDSFSYKASSGSGITFKRLPDGNGNWTTGSADLGFYNNTSQSCVAASPTPTPSPAIFGTPSPSPVPVQIIEKIFLSEAMVNPLSGEKEWIEIYNDNDFEVTLFHWFIDDNEDGGSAPKTFTLIVPAKSFSTIEVSTSIFNNDGDSVRILDTNEVEKDTFDYLYSEKGKSWGRISFDTNLFCLQEPSKNEKNKNCIVAESQTTTLAKVTKATTKKVVVKNQATPSLPIKTKTTRSKTASSPIKKAVVDDTPPDQGEVLSAQTSNAPSFSKILSVLSLSYSTLTMASIFLKMKIGIETQFS